MEITNASNFSTDMDRANVNQAGNVQLAQSDSAVTSELRGPQPVQQDVVREGHLDKIAKELTDRWIMVSEFEVSSNLIQGNIVSQLDLPTALYATGKTRGSNAYSVIRNYMYFRADVELTFEIAATRMQTGQLQVSYYYATEEDVNRHYRDNIYVRSAMNATVVNITDSQSCNVYIPYVYPNKYLRTRGAHGVRNKNFCTVEVRVLAPIRSSAQDPHTSISVVVFARLSNLRVEGMIPSEISLATHEMMALKHILIGAAEGALGSIKGNRDYPRDPNCDTRIVPVQSQSWCVGRNSKIPLSVLRLDNLGITQREENNELNVHNIASKAGLINDFSWDNSQRNGTILYKVQASPVHKRKIIGAEPNELACYYGPPVTCLASLFKYWRGTLKFTVDICASAFHNGRLVLNFFPGISHLGHDSQKHLVPSNMSNTLSTQINLKTDRTVTFNVPFNYDRDFKNVYDADHNMDGSIGLITVSVLNKLVLIGEVSSSVQCFVYISACDDMEFSVPTSSVLGLSWDRHFIDPMDSSVRFKPGYEQVYIGLWRFWPGPILRYSVVTDRISQINNGEYNVVYGSDKSVSNWTGVACKFFCCPRVKGDSARYLIPFTSLEKAKLYVTEGTIEDMSREGSYNKFVDLRDVILKVQYRAVIRHESEDNVILSKCNTMTRDLFGEDFSDLKDYIRRFQPYTNFDIVLNEDNQFGRVLASIPLTFSSLSIDLGFKQNLDLVSNKTRNGSLALLASAFRYFSGSMRVRIVIDCKEKELVFNAVHVPNSKIQNYKISTATTSDHLNSCIGGYANVAQAVSINQVLDVEVPYYNPTPISFLQRGILDDTNLEGLESLGCLNISVLGKPSKVEQVSFHVYIAAGDDTSFSNFCGFPMVTFSGDVPDHSRNLRVEHETFSFFAVRDTISQTAELIPNANKVIKEANEIMPDLKEAVPTVTTAAREVEEAAKKLGSGAEKVDDALSSCADFFKTLGRKGIELTKFFYNIAYNCYAYFRDATLFMKDLLYSLLGSAWEKIKDIGIRMSAAVRYLTTKFNGSKKRTLKFFIQNCEGTKVDTRDIFRDLIRKFIAGSRKAERKYDQAFTTFVGKELTGFLNKRRIIAKLRGDYAFYVQDFNILDESLNLYLKDWKPLTNEAEGRDLKVEIVEAYPNIIFSSCKNAARVLLEDTPEECLTIFKSLRNMAYFEKCDEATLQFEYGNVFEALLQRYDPLERYSLHSILVESYALSDEKMTMNWEALSKQTDCCKLNLKKHAVVHENESKERSEINPNTDLSSDDASSLVALGLSVVSFMTGSKTSIKNPVGLGKEFFANIGTFSRNSNYLITFTKNFVDLIKKLTIKAIKLACPTFIPSSEKEDAYITFLKESISLTDPINEAKIKKSKSLMTKLRSNKVLADTLVSRMDQNDKSHHSTFTRLMQKKLETTCANISHFALSTKARYDPFVLCLVGPPNIGKSYLIDECARILVDNVNLKYSSENLTFTRFPGNQFWQMIEDQPILVYDDFLAIGGQADETVLSEFLTIKSTQTFNPPVAELANKNQFYNPLGVILTTNNAFPDIKSARCPQAVHRRRDCLVHCRKREEYAEVQTRTISKDVLTRYGHLEFCIQTDPLDSRFTPMNYVSYEVFVDELKKYHQIYHQNEMPNYLNREARTNILTQEYDEEEVEKFVADHYSKDEILEKVKNTVDLSSIIPNHEMDEERTERRRIIERCPHEDIYEDWGLCAEIVKGERVHFLIDDCGHRVPLDCNSYNCEMNKENVRLPADLGVFKILNPHLFSKGVVGTIDSNMKRPSVLDQQVEEDLRKSIFTKFDNYLYSMEKKGFGRFWSYLGLLVCGLGTVAGAITMAFKVTKWMTASGEKKETEETEHQHVESSGDQDMRKKPKSKKNASIKKELDKFRFGRADHNMEVEHQQQDESQHLSDLQEMIRNNFFELVVETNNSPAFKAKGIGLCGRYCLIVKHFFESWISYGKPKMFLEVSGGRFELNENSFEIFAEDTSSLALVHFCKSVPLFRDIRKHIATTDQHSLLTNDCLLYWKEKKGTQSRILSVDVGHDLYINGTPHMDEQNLSTVYQYKFSGKGSCGNILISLNRMPKIVGIHVAGTGGRGYGYAQPVLMEQFSSLDARGRIANPIMHEFGVPDIEIETEVLHDGIIEDHMKVFFPSKTRLETLETYGQFHEPTKVPSPLSKFDERVEHNIPPLQSGVNKHGYPPLNFDNQLLYESYMDLQDKILATSKPIFKNMGSVLTHKVVFEGIPGEQGYSGLKLDTSEGYPLVKLRGPRDHDKRWLFEFDMTDSVRNFLGYNKELGDYIEENERLRRKGIIPNALFLDALKDTLIKETKLQKPGCTRVFSESPVELTIAFKRYFGHFQAALTQNRINNEMSVGINAEGREWGDVVRYLVSDEQEPKIITGDYSHYGDSIDSVCLFYAFQIALEWYKFHFHGEENFQINQKVRETLVEEILHPQHLVENKVYRMFCGIPSGFALTVEMNSLVNSLYMRMAFLDTGLSLRDFNRGVKSLFYGDDLILSVASCLIEKFNFTTISEFLARHNIKFTSADKESTSNDPFISIWEATFLKRGFRPHPFRASEYLSPLPEDSLLSQTDYSWTSDRPKDVAIDNSRSALRLAHCLGPEYHAKLRRKITDYWIRQGLKFDSNTWKEEDNRVYL